MTLSRLALGQRFLLSQFTQAQRCGSSCKTGGFARVGAQQLVRAQYSTNQTEVPKAATLIIGNEVLSGKIQDANTAYLAKLLYARGVDMVRVEIVPDDPSDIVQSVQRLSERVGPTGFVFTSGGIGPTHDDVTYQSIADAFGRTLEVHEGTKARMTEHYAAQGKEVNQARLRMATLPTDCEVLETPGLWVPLVRVENVYILPGIPRLFTAMVEANKARFTGATMSLQTLYTHQGEGEIAEELTQIANRFAAVGVQIGSYPHTGKAALEYTTKLCFEGRDEGAVLAAVDAAKAQMQVWEA